MRGSPPSGLGGSAGWRNGAPPREPRPIRLANRPRSAFPESSMSEPETSTAEILVHLACPGVATRDYRLSEPTIMKA